MFEYIFISKIIGCPDNKNYCGKKLYPEIIFNDFHFLLYLY